MTGVWHEGLTLPREIELASQFAVSRTSIRESLSILKAKGLIAARQKAGTHVRDRVSWNMLDADLLEWTLAQRPTEDFVHQLLEVRRIVEPEACAICAVRGSDTDLARIERAYRDMDTAGMDREAYSEPDLRFHRGNPHRHRQRFPDRLRRDRGSSAETFIRAFDPKSRRATQEPALSPGGARRDSGRETPNAPAARCMS